MGKFVKLGYIALALFTLFSMVAVSGCPQITTTTTTTTITTTTATTRERARERQTTTTQAPATTTTQISRQRQQNDYLGFEDRFFAIMQPTLDAIENLTDTLDRLENRDATIDEAVQAAQRVKQESRQAANAYPVLDVPGSLPTNVRNILEQAKTNASNSFFEIANAADATTRALEAPPGSSEEAAANRETVAHLDESNRLLGLVIANLNSARQELGLPKLSSSRKLKLQGLFKNDWIPGLKQVQEKSKRS